MLLVVGAGTAYALRSTGSDTNSAATSESEARATAPAPPPKPQLDDYDQSELRKTVREAARVCNQVDAVNEDLDAYGATDDAIGAAGSVSADSVLLRVDVEAALDAWKKEPDAVMSSGEPAQEHIEKLAALLVGCEDRLANRLQRTLTLHE